MNVKHVVMRGGSGCQCRPSFFGLGPDYQEIVYEEIFVLKHHGGWSFVEAYSLPVQLRRWFVERLIKEFENQNKAMDDAQRGDGHS